MAGKRSDNKGGGGGGGGAGKPIKIKSTQPSGGKGSKVGKKGGK